VQIYDFTAFSRRTPTSQHPGDRLDAQFRNHADAIRELIAALGALQAPKVEDVVPLAVALIEARLAPVLERREIAARETIALRAALEAMRSEGERREARTAEAMRQAQGAARIAQEASRTAVDARDVLQALPPQKSTPPPPAPLLGPNTGGFYGVDTQGATAVAADWAQVSIEWAEWMPDVIPNQTLAVTGITGDHWSSRWWANKSANAFGMLAWWYQGGWPDPGPPNTPFTPTNEPLPLGAMYFNTGRNEMMVWTGMAWVPLGMPAPAVTSALYFPTAAGKTAYPTTAADLFGHSFTLLADGSNGIAVHANGVRLTPDDGTGTLGDYLVNPASSSVTLTRAMPAGYVLAIDVLVPPAQLQPAATKITKMKPFVFNGVQVSFTLQGTDNSTPTVNNATELFVSLDGVPQEPVVAYACTGATLTFVTAPAADAYAYVLWYHPPGAP
jgi:hypothetical protein